MTKEEYLTFHKDACMKMVTLTIKKNADYAGAGTNPFHNFTQVESAGICSTEQGFLTRMSDKFSRIATFVKKGVLLVEDESVEDTLLDLANYCILMAGYIKAKKQDAKRPNAQMHLNEEWLNKFHGPDYYYYEHTEDID